MYSTAVTTRQGEKADTDAKVVKATNLDGPLPSFVARPSSSADTPDGSALGAKRLCLDVPSDTPVAKAQGKRPVPTPTTVAICQSICPKGKRNTSYVLNSFPKIYPPYDATPVDVSTPLGRLEVEKITRYQSISDRGEVIAAMYETQWTGLSRPS